MKDVTCKRCMYWEQIPYKGPPGEMSKGMCHRFPPHKQDDYYSVTTEEDWCGEFTPDPKKDAD